MLDVTYETIVEDVEFGFKEYIDENNFTVSQATSKIIEDKSIVLTKNMFIKYSYFVRLSIESINKKNRGLFV